MNDESNVATVARQPITATVTRVCAEHSEAIRGQLTEALEALELTPDEIANSEGFAALFERGLRICTEQPQKLELTARLLVALVRYPDANPELVSAALYGVEQIEPYAVPLLELWANPIGAMKDRAVCVCNLRIDQAKYVFPKMTEGEIVQATYMLQRAGLVLHFSLTELIALRNGSTMDTSSRHLIMLSPTTTPAGSVLASLLFKNHNHLRREPLTQLNVCVVERGDIHSTGSGTR